MKFRKVFAFLTVSLISILAASSVWAEDAAEAAEAAVGDEAMKAFAAALTICVAAAAGAFAQGRAAAAALESIGRNPQAAGRILTPMILGLALIESLVIYALVVAFMILP